MVGICLQSVLISICTGNLGMFDILQFEITNWNFFLVWKQPGYLYQFKLCFFPSFWARVKFIPFLQFTEIYITSFWSGGFTTPTAVNQRNGNLGNSIFVHFEMTFLTTLTGILDFANLVFQTGIFSQFKLGKKIKLDISNWWKSKFYKIPVQIDKRIGWLMINFQCTQWIHVHTVQCTVIGWL